jgi:hypothetical protein
VVGLLTLLLPLLLALLSASICSWAAAAPVEGLEDIMLLLADLLLLRLQLREKLPPAAAAAATADAGSDTLSRPSLVVLLALRAARLSSL